MENQYSFSMRILKGRLHITSCNQIENPQHVAKSFAKNAYAHERSEALWAIQNELKLHDNS